MYFIGEFRPHSPVTIKGITALPSAPSPGYHTVLTYGQLYEPSTQQQDLQSIETCHVQERRSHYPETIRPKGNAKRNSYKLSVLFSTTKKQKKTLKLCVFVFTYVFPPVLSADTASWMCSPIPKPRLWSLSATRQVMSQLAETLYFTLFYRKSHFIYATHLLPSTSDLSSEMHNIRYIQNIYVCLV